jgi:RNA polymerase sigma-70 factor (ECF subfamily)
VSRRATKRAAGPVYYPEEVVRVRPGGELDDLVEAARAGDRLAFEQLLERDAPIAYRAALAVLRSPTDAEDALQEATFRAWERLPQLRDAATWTPWFRRIAIRAAIDHARRGYHRREVNLDPGVATEADSTADADERLTLLAAIGLLPPDDRAILGLRYAADLQVADVADALGIRLGTAKARLHRALGRLRAALGEKGGTDGA